jgi:hypothetical protein
MQLHTWADIDKALGKVQCIDEGKKGRDGCFQATMRDKRIDRGNKGIF